MATIVYTNDAILLFIAVANLTTLLSFRSVFLQTADSRIMYASAARVYHQGQDKLYKKGCPQAVSPTVLPVPHPCPDTEWMIRINPLSVLPNPLTPVPAPTSTAFMEIILVDEEALRQPRSCVPTVFSFLKSLFTVC